MPAVAFYTLGCKVNFYDTEAIWQLFKHEGYEQVDFDEQTADVYLINTCTVTNTGDKKSRQIIRRAIRRNPDAIVAVTGCYAQTSPAEILDIPGVDLVVGTQDRDKILPYVKQIQESPSARTMRYATLVNSCLQRKWMCRILPDRTRAFLKIQDGCNNFCTFCIIPWSPWAVPQSGRPQQHYCPGSSACRSGATRRLCSRVFTLVAMVMIWRTTICLICCGIWKKVEGTGAHSY